MSGIYEIRSVLKPNMFYIGSAVNLKGRKSVHFSLLRDKKHDNIKMQRHANKYGIGDLIFTVIENCNREDLIEREQFYIDGLKPTFNLNPKAGNCFGRKLSSKTKKKISDKVSAKMPQTRIKLSKSRKGRFTGEDNPFFGKKHTEETKTKISNKNKGKPSPMRGRRHTEAAIQKMRELGLQRRHTEETKEKCRILSTGRKHTEATKKKISDANMGHVGYTKGTHPHTAEGNERIRVAMTGRIVSDETKLRQRNSRILYNNKHPEHMQYINGCRLLLKLENKVADMLIESLNKKMGDAEK